MNIGNPIDVVLMGSGLLPSKFCHIFSHPDSEAVKPAPRHVYLLAALFHVPASYLL